MSKIKVLKVFLSLLVLLGMTSCATTVNLNVTRPAELNLESVGSIAILPFGTTGSFRKANNKGRYKVLDFFVDVLTDETEQRRIADSLQSSLEKEFINSPYLKLMDSNAVREAVRRGNESPADVYLVGDITRFDSDVKVKSVKVKEEEKTVLKDYWWREVYFGFEYKVVDGETSEIMYTESFSFYEKSSENEDRGYLPSERSMLSSDLSSIVTSISRKVQPYNVVKSISLLKDKKTKDPQMEQANKLAKNGFVQESIKLYTSIYENKRYFEAGYNAAALLEAQGKFTEALELAEEVSKIYPDKKIFNLISDINYEISMKKKLENQNFSLKYL